MAASEEGGRSQEQKLIEATIECIEREGIQGVTVRQIAEIADVNIAAINYYFRSKDRLVEQAMAQTIRNVFDDWVDLLEDERLDVRAQLRPILEELIEGAERYPGLSRAHLYGPLIEREPDTPFTMRFRTFLGQLVETVQTERPDASEVRIRYGLVQLFSSAFFPALAPGFFGEHFPLPLTSAEGRNTYIDVLLEGFFHCIEPSASV